MHRRAYLRAAAGASAVGLSGCLGFLSSDAEEYDVGMSTIEFRPEEYTVSAGDTVVWRNTSKQGHTVTAYEDGIPDDAAYFASGDYDSESAARDAWGDRTDGVLTQGQTFEHAFEVPGTYEYVCLPHESRGMAGRIVVEE
ncbi:plastocyanin/azurin family copper-binding protein [Halomicrobium salinisoli]|uniref:plastocyanin/azurin family copper-binding protein n=1 Tax=Halomicrobium salinisoli TaxID=2878391 RepID=UPI001CF09F52|nr:plastocyanin/azurin family copper-binding protein [Halomicrobium salinisoli]